MIGVSGLGSVPGTDLPAAIRMAFAETPQLPYLPELPGRGPASDMLGRAVGLLVDLPGELRLGRWRLGWPGADQRRAAARLRDDLDLLEEHTQGYSGRLKVSVCGPWTLAAQTELSTGGSTLSDAVACSDLAASLAEGVGDLVEGVRRRVPGADLILQVDEPMLPLVLEGAVPSPGGYFRQAAIELETVCRALATVRGEAARRGHKVPSLLHSCAPGLPVAALTRADGAGFESLAVDVDTLDVAATDALASAVDAGTTAWLGVLPTAPVGVLPRLDDLRRRTLQVIERIGVTAAEQIVLTPACGLAGWPAAAVPQGFRLLGRLARQVEDELAS